MRIKIISLISVMATLSFYLGLGNLPFAQALTSTANSSADTVIGQVNMTSSDIPPASTNTLLYATKAYTNGTKLFIADTLNNRVLIYNSIPTSNNASADVVIGQQNMTSSDANQGGSPGANTLAFPSGISSDGTKLFIADTLNNRILIYNSIPTSNNASADVVIGQQNMTSSGDNQGGSAGANTLFFPVGVYSNGTKLFISDCFNNRVLIYNSAPTSDNAGANVVVGQTNMTNTSANQGVAVGANTLDSPRGVYADGTKLIISDTPNGRVLIYNSIPVSNNASADVVIGQQNMTSNGDNQGGSAGANTLSFPQDIHSDGVRLFIADGINSRVLIYNSIPASNNASADVVVGQTSMSENAANQGGSARANTTNQPIGVFAYGSNLFVGDTLNNRVLIYKLKPTLTEVTPVSASGSDSTPSVTFSTDEAGTISYSGDCSSSTTAATVGNNTVTFNSLADGTYSNCKIAVTDGAGFASASLSLTPFRINTDSTAVSEDADTVTSNVSSLNCSSKHTRSKRITFTFSGLSLSNLKKNKSKAISIKLNNKRIRPSRVVSHASSVRIVVRLKCKDWRPGSYDLAMSYKYKSGKHTIRGSRAQTGILTIN